MRDEQHSVIMDAVTSSMAEDESAVAPQRIRVRFPGQGRQVSVSYSSLSLNEAHPSFAYSIPSNARTIVR
jgi:hypothetical protein